MVGSKIDTPEGARIRIIQPSVSACTESGVSLNALQHTLDVQQRRLAAIVGEKPNCTAVSTEHRNSRTEEVSEQQNKHFEKLVCSVPVAVLTEKTVEVEKQQSSLLADEIRETIGNWRGAVDEQSAALARQDTTLRRCVLEEGAQLHQELEAHVTRTAESIQADVLELQQAMECVRADQRSVFAAQTNSLRKEFEAAFRAEELADAALTRVVALETCFADIRARIYGEEMKDARSAEDDVVLSRRLEEMTSLISRLDERLARLEIDLDRNLAAQDERLVESLVHSRRALNRIHVDEEGVAAREQRLRQEVIVAAKDCLYGEMAEAATRSEETCIERMRIASCETAASLEMMVAHQSLQLSSCAPAVESLHARFLQKENISSAKLSELRSGFAEDLSEVASSVAVAHEGFTNELRTERQVRMKQAQEIRSELIDALMVLKTQFEDWMNVVDSLRSDVDVLMEANKGSLGGMVQSGSQREVHLLSTHAESVSLVAEARTAARECVALACADLSARILADARQEWTRETCALSARLDEIARLSAIK
eukprot:TRINITY_DN936_c0_g3_i2.p1 TRINITY_DN936_c0_g3~~TRINITY_DN936_c0_g3_i2.p1  ORF type:complete len:636 (+),score=70.94 TRINITY_DN936_c0_g3_i2:282-1910(+)